MNPFERIGESDAQSRTTWTKGQRYLLVLAFEYYEKTRGFNGFIQTLESGTNAFGTIKKELLAHWEAADQVARGAHVQRTR